MSIAKKHGDGRVLRRLNSTAASVIVCQRY